MVITILGWGLLTVAQTLSGDSDLRALDLRCEGQVSPLGAGEAPRLSWRAESNRRADSVSAWQVQVASEGGLLGDGVSDLWDSGRRNASRTPHVIYGGEALQAGAVCHWRVRLWDADGRVSPWSATAIWEVAPLTMEDWGGAVWIDDGRALPKDDASFYEEDPAPRFCGQFDVAKPVAKARLHVAGLGLFRAQINGAPIAPDEFGPPWTVFDKRVLFSTYDVTEFLSLIHI